MNLFKGAMICEQKKMPEPLRQGERAKQRKGQNFYHPQFNTTWKKFYNKIQRDRELLATCGLGFREDRGFSRLVKIGGHHGR